MAKTVNNAARSSAINFAWPEDEEGKPKALVSQQMSELINLGNYSNITVGPASVFRYVDDDVDSRRQGLIECAEDCEFILSIEREKLNTELQKK